MGMSIAVVRYHHGTNKLRIFFMEVIRGSSEAIAQLSAEICCISCCDLFLKNMEMALCVWLEDKTQSWLVGSAVRKMVMPVKAGMRYISEVEKSSTYSHPCFW
jgi:hypothetical protein